MQAISFKFNMGDRVKDIVSGYTGVILAMTYYSTGCRHYGIAPEKTGKDGNIREYEWLDESRLVLVKSARERKRKPTGGPGQNPVVSYNK